MNLQYLLGRVIRLPLKLLPKNLIVRVVSGINKGFKWRVGSTVHGCWLGFYESDKQQVIKNIVKRDMIIYDIGANAGFYTLAFSRLVGKEGKVYSFEPLAENANNILRHININKCNNTFLYQIAISDVDGMSTFNVNETSNSMGSLSQTGGGYLIPIFTIDTLIKEHNVPVPNIIKMDVEGAESSVLMGSKKLLEMKMTTWLIALHGEVQKKECYSILTQYGYKIYHLDGYEILGPEIETDEIYAMPNLKNNVPHRQCI